MTYQERYFGIASNGSNWAPSTLGCPANLISVDYAAFKKTAAEKLKLYSFKKSMLKTKHTKFETVLKASF